MFQAIVTKYIGPTNTRGSRVKATASAGSVTLHWDHALNSEDNHAAAAKALAEKFGWRGEWHGGGLPDDRGNCYVCGNIGGHVSFVTYAGADDLEPARVTQGNLRQWHDEIQRLRDACRIAFDFLDKNGNGWDEVEALAALRDALR